MKRSDMIKLITEITLDSSTSFSLNKKEATIILNKLENAGMLPPLRSANYKDDFWDKAICAEMDGLDIKVATWETEDVKQKRKRNNV